MKNELIRIMVRALTIYGVVIEFSHLLIMYYSLQYMDAWVSITKVINFKLMMPSGGDSFFVCH